MRTTGQSYHVLVNDVEVDMSTTPHIARGQYDSEVKRQLQAESDAVVTLVNGKSEVLKTTHPD